jgi:polyhydroxyalkanoate synthesis regulator phasin
MAGTKTATSRVDQVGDSVRRVQAEVERLVSRARKSFDDLTAERSGVLEGMIKQAKRIRGDLRKRADATFERVEQRVNDVVEPVARRLNVATRADVEALAERVARLEKQIRTLSKSAEAA